MKISCPSNKYSKEKRIKLLFESMNAWINSAPLNSLIELFGGNIRTVNFIERIEKVNDFVNVWDYRKKIEKQQLLNERWNLSDDDFVNTYKTFILEQATKLGLVHTQPIELSPTHILPLGGARYSNLHRVELAQQVIHQNKLDHQVKVVALSGMRVINEKERQTIDTYAPNAMTEYDAINAGLETVFQLGNTFSEERQEHTNQNLNSCVRIYEKTYCGIQVCSVAAPSQSPDRRANSRDTFEYFLSLYNIDSTSSLLLVTSQIYVPYQLLKFTDLAIEGGYNVECIGTQMNASISLSNATNYLQEIKSTVNAIYALSHKYANEI